MSSDREAIRKGFELKHPLLEYSKYSGERNCYVTTGPMDNLAKLVIYNKLWNYG
jgi:hypothetical protein